MHWQPVEIRWPFCVHQASASGSQSPSLHKPTVVIGTGCHGDKILTQTTEKMLLSSRSSSRHPFQPFSFKMKNSEIEISRQLDFGAGWVEIKWAEHCQCSPLASYASSCQIDDNIRFGPGECVKAKCRGLTAVSQGLGKQSLLWLSHNGLIWDLLLSPWRMPGLQSS